MAVGGYYLAVRVGRTLMPMVQAYGDCVRNYFLPAFDNLNDKADEVAARIYDELMQQPASGDDDPAEAAEAAQDRGIEFYETMYAMRQSTLNMFAAGLFHLIEQQLTVLGEDATFQAMGVHVPETKLDRLADWYMRHLRLDLRALPAWPIVDELRLAANSVKHGEGGSANQLRQVRPDLFVDPRLKEFGLGHNRVPVLRRLSAPLAGEDLFITSEVFEGYAEASVALLRQIQEHFLVHRDEEYPETD